MPDDPAGELARLHRDRARAESFGSVAEDYERYRPHFPDPLLDDLAALASGALDVACGTGRVARGLTERGLSLLGVELDPRMAEIARGHGIPVEVGRFEEWDDAGRRFDLLTCGDAWHWIEPTAGAAKAAEVLRPGGWLTRLWNVQVLDDAVVKALEPVYQEHAPGVRLHGKAPPVTAPDPFPLMGPFSPSEPRTYRWERRVTVDDWVGFLGTVSDLQRLPAPRLALLQEAVRSILAGFGEGVVVHGSTLALFARRDRA